METQLPSLMKELTDAFVNRPPWADDRASLFTLVLFVLSFICGTIYAAIALYAALEAHYGPVDAALMTAGASFLVTLVTFIALYMRSERQKRRRRAKASALNHEVISLAAATLDALEAPHCR